MIELIELEQKLGNCRYSTKPMIDTMQVIGEVLIKVLYELQKINQRIDEVDK